MAIAVLFPSSDHPAIEERFASWQAESRLRRGAARFYFYPPGAAARDIAADVDEEYALVVTDPLVVAPEGIAASLQHALGGADAAVPVSNVAANPAQTADLPSLYMTLRELDLVMDQMRKSGAPVEYVKWGKEDPSLFLCRTEMLDRITAPPTEALNGRRVVIVRSEYVHRWSSMRGQVRDDLLTRIPTEARSILEFGCGEATLGYALKQRQQCRVVGIELDPAAAAIAKRRIDDVYQGDAAEIISFLSEPFEWIIGGDIVEHLPDPWSFLAQLRRISTPGGHLLLSLPNLASASIVADLLAGRFDYVYMGLACVGHLRFFTRRSIEEMLTMSGWIVVDISPQPLEPTPQGATLINRLESGGVPFSRDDLAASGYYVIARNG